MQDTRMNASDAERMLRLVAAQDRQQQEAQQQMMHALQSTLQQPTRVTRLNATLVGLADDGPHKVLMIATPSGERVDVPLSPMALRQIMQAASEKDAA